MRFEKEYTFNSLTEDREKSLKEIFSIHVISEIMKLKEIETEANKLYLLDNAFIFLQSFDEKIELQDGKLTLELSEEEIDLLSFSIGEAYLYQGWDSLPITQLNEESNYVFSVDNFYELPKTEDEKQKYFAQALDFAFVKLIDKYSGAIKDSAKNKSLFLENAFVVDYDYSDTNVDAFFVATGFLESLVYFMELEEEYSVYSFAKSSILAKEDTTKKSVILSKDELDEKLKAFRSIIYHYNNVYVNSSVVAKDLDLRAEANHFIVFAEKITAYIEELGLTQDEYLGVEFFYEDEKLAFFAVNTDVGNIVPALEQLSLLKEEPFSRETSQYLLKFYKDIIQLDTNLVSIEEFIAVYIRPKVEYSCASDKDRNSKDTDKDLSDAGGNDESCTTSPITYYEKKLEIDRKILNVNAKLEKLREIRKLKPQEVDIDNIFTMLKSGKNIAVSDFLTYDIPSLLNSWYTCQFGTDLTCQGILKEKPFLSNDNKRRFDTLKSRFTDRNKNSLESYKERSAVVLSEFENQFKTTQQTDIEQIRESLEETKLSLKKHLISYDLDFVSQNFMKLTSEFLDALIGEIRSSDENILAETIEIQKPLLASFLNENILQVDDIEDVRDSVYLFVTDFLNGVDDELLQKFNDFVDSNDFFSSLNYISLLNEKIEEETQKEHSEKYESLYLEYNSFFLKEVQELKKDILVGSRIFSEIKNIFEETINDTINSFYSDIKEKKSVQISDLFSVDLYSLNQNVFAFQVELNNSSEVLFGSEEIFLERIAELRSKNEQFVREMDAKFKDIDSLSFDSLNGSDRPRIKPVVDGIRSLASGKEFCFSNLDFVSQGFCGANFGVGFNFRMPFLPYIRIFDFGLGSVASFERLFKQTISNYFRDLRKSLEITLNELCKDGGNDEGIKDIEYDSTVEKPFLDDYFNQFVDSEEEYELIIAERESYIEEIIDNFSPIDLCSFYSGTASNKDLVLLGNLKKKYSLLDSRMSDEAILEFNRLSGLDFGLDICESFFDSVVDPDFSFIQRVLPKAPKCSDEVKEITRNRLISKGIPLNEVEKKIELEDRRRDQLADKIQDLLNSPATEEDFEKCLKEQGVSQLDADLGNEILTLSDFIMNENLRIFLKESDAWKSNFFSLEAYKKEVNVVEELGSYGITGDDADKLTYTPEIKNLLNQGLTEEELGEIILDDEIKKDLSNLVGETYTVDATRRVLSPGYFETLGKSDSISFVNTFSLKLPIYQRRSELENNLLSIYPHGLPQEIQDVLDENRSIYDSIEMVFSDEDLIKTNGLKEHSHFIEKTPFAENLYENSSKTSGFRKDVISTYLQDKLQIKSSLFDSEVKSTNGLLEVIYKDIFNNLIQNIKSSDLVLPIAEQGDSYVYKIQGVKLSPDKCDKSPNPLHPKDTRARTQENISKELCQKPSAESSVLEDVLSDSFLDPLIRIHIFDNLLRGIFASGSVYNMNFENEFIKRHIVEKFTETLNLLSEGERQKFIQLFNTKTEFKEEIKSRVDILFGSVCLDINNIFQISPMNNMIYSLMKNVFQEKDIDRARANIDLGLGTQTNVSLGTFQGNLNLNNLTDEGIKIERYVNVILRELISPSNLALIKSVDGFNFISENEEYYVDIAAFNAFLGKLESIADLKNYFSDVRYGVRMVVSSNRGDVVDLIEPHFKEENNKSKLYIYRRASDKVVNIPISSFEIDVYEMSFSTKKSNIERYTDDLFDTLLFNLSNTEDSKLFIDEVMILSDVINFLYLHNVYTMEQTTDIENTFNGTKTDLLRKILQAGMSADFTTEALPGFMQDREQFEKDFDAATNKDNPDWLPEFINPAVTKLKGLEGLRFALIATRTAIETIFKAYVETTDPNISIASKVHYFTGKKIPTLALSLAQLPINVFGPFGFGPPITPAGFLYLALYGLDLKSILNKEDESEDIVKTQSQIDGEC